MILRRRQMPASLQPRWRAFQAQAERVEQARQALLGCLPVGRVDRAPPDVGLDLVADELAEVAATLDAWKCDEVAEHWQRCADATQAARAAIPAARAVAERSDELEELLEVVTAVVEPLSDWADAERAWLALRTR